MRRLQRDQRGAAAVIFALALPVVVGGFGLGSEASSWYFTQRKLQNAADVAAFAAASELRAGRSLARMEAAAVDAAIRSGYRDQIGSLVVTAPFAGAPSDVEVRIEERVQRGFSGLFSAGEVPIRGRALARITQGVQTCVLALDPTAPRAVTFSGNSETILVGCNVHSNSMAGDSIYIQGSPDVQVDCISAAGQVHLAAENLLRLTSCVAPYERADIVPDPYADLLVPPVGGPCQSDSGAVLSPGRYCNELRLQSGVTLQPGVYVLDRGMRINASANVQGDGVTFYVRGSNNVHFNGNATIQLSAPTSGDYSGVLIFGDRNAASNTTHTINGNASSFLNGAIYAASGTVDYLGNNDNNGGCSQVVSRMVRFTGNSSVGIDCTAVTTRDIRSSRLIMLVE